MLHSTRTPTKGGTVLTCPACDRESPDDFAFCPGCGARLTAQSLAEVEPTPLSEERKVVTALFCDLVSYTAHSEAADHELIDGLLQHYNALARRLVETHGGMVEKFIGDAVLAVFGFPKAHDDDPERAVRCGLRLVEAASRLTWPDGDPVQVRIGVNSGETYLHTDVDPSSGETFLTGDAVNTAARLETAAPPDGLVAGELTHALTEHAIAYEELEPLKVKGKKEPVRAWLARALQESRGRTGLRTTGATDTPFLGRDAELRRLLAALAAASASNEAHFTLLVGEPGIGKSRLVLEFARTLGERPGPITWRQGRCPPFGEGIAFWALGEIVKVHAGMLDSDDVAAVEEKLEAVLPVGDERPWLRQRLRPVLGLEAPPASPDESFAAWTRFLEHVASLHPTVLVFEDLHWAGEGMLAFVEYLAAHPPQAPLLVVATTRPELPAKRSHTLEPADGVDRLTLSPLNRRDASRLVTALLDERLASHVRAPMVERCGGNPLYAEEYVRLLLDRGLLLRTKGVLRLKEGEKLPVPDTVQAVLAARLDTLPSEHKALLCDAAVLGESFSGGGVAALAGCSPADVDEAMAALAERQLVRPAARSSLAGGREYLFWHALTRDIAYGQLPRKVRVVKHTAAADWVEGTAGDRTRELAEVLAYHYATAFELAEGFHTEAVAGLRGPALRYLTLAGERTEPLDGDAAERYYGRAIALAPGSTAERFRLMARRAVVVSLRGRVSEAAADLETAVAGLLESGDTRAAAAAMSELSNALWYLGDPRHRDVSAAAVKLVATDAPSPVMVDVLLGRAALLHEDEGPRRALEEVDRAMTIAESLGVPIPAMALSLRGRARCTLGDAGGLDDLREAIEAAEREGRRVDQAALLEELAWCLVSFEGPAPALQALASEAEIARGSHMEGLSIGARTMTVRSLYWAGRWDTALAECRELAPILDEGADAYGLAIVHYVWSLLLLGRGDAARAAPLSAQALAVARDNPIRGVSAVYLVAAAAARHGVGDRDAALALLEECRETLRSKGDTVFVYMLPLAVRTAVAAESLDLAKSLTEGVTPLLPFGQHVDITLRAQAREIDGEHEAAAAGFADAAARWHDFGIPYEEGQARLGEGRCLLALGRVPEAAPVLEGAREIFARLGARPALEEAEALLRPS